MAEKQITTLDFSGGIASVSEKKDVANSARFIKGLNPFEDPAYITQAKKTTKVSGSTVDGLVHWAEDGSPWSTNRYFYDSGGKIYQETSAGSWSSLRTVSGGAGQGLLIFDNYLYYPQAIEMGRYGPLDGTPAFQDSFSGWWIASQLQDTGGGTGQTFATATTISEAVTSRQTFVANHDPIKSIVIDINDTGDDPNWTVTFHDAANNVVGSKQVLFASITTGDNTFTLASPLRLTVGETYHFHVTTSTTTGAPKVTSNTASDLEGAEFTINYGTIISATFHPAVEFLNGFAFGNKDYIGYFDNATYNPNKISLAPGFEVRAMTKVQEFVIAECWRGPSFSESEEQRRYFWDGISPTYNFFVDITAGVPHAVHNSKNGIIAVYGNTGRVFGGGDTEGAKLSVIVDGVPKLARGKKVEVYPGAITEHEGRTLIGYAASTDDGSTLEQGIYEIGNQIDSLPLALNYPYQISTGTTSATTVKIGCVKSFGDDLYIGWRDDATYGVDKVNIGDSASAAGSWENRIFDGGDPNDEKQAIKVEIEFEALATGQSVTPKYGLDRATSFTTGTAASTVGDTNVSLYINTIYKEAECGFNLASTSNTFIKIKSVNFVYDDLENEAKSA